MSKKRILVIDDELGPRESLRFLFKKQYEIECAESVDKGVASLKKNPPDIVIMDIRMPEKTGIEGLREIREIDPQVSIVMLTGFGSLETAQEAIRHGATDYLKKPFDTDEIQETIAKYIGRTRLVREQLETTKNLNSLAGQLQEQLDAKQEMASLGEKSSEFVHDLANPLSVINGYIQILLQDIQDRKSGDGKLNVTYLEQIDRSVHRCRDMLSLWRERAKRMSSSTKKLSVEKLVKEAADNAALIAREKKSAAVEMSTGPECFIEGDNVQVFRAIQNVAGNAIEALPASGGRVELSWTTDKTKVVITVKDNGCGIPEDKIKDFQTKYYTTKKESGGMGLGLFITKNIVEAHGGEFKLGNNPDGGACVTLAFPRLS